jgi:adenosylcobyric acid synthase
MSGDRTTLFEEVKMAYHRLSARYNPIVMEGAGSISELNLKARDITNMRMAIAAGAATYLITDIDRGGIFGSLYGTIALLEPEEKACIKGIIVNKFRGDAALFQEGVKMIEQLCGVPVIGIMPYFRDIFIEEEDTVGLQQKRSLPVKDKVNIAIVLVGRMSNFTDFDRLDKDSRLNLYYTHTQEGISGADIIILPGSKNTIEDLIELRNNGLAAAVVQAHRNGKTVIGICGGFQMMGQLIEDPLHVESAITEVAGLGILPVRTVLLADKTTRQCDFTYRNYPEHCKGYEIHMGETVSLAEAKPTAHLSDGQDDGYYLSEKCWGSYLHGILDNPLVINELVAPYTDEKVETADYRSFREEQYDKLAALLRANLDIEQVYQQLKD